MKNVNIEGLTKKEVLKLQTEFGKNELVSEKKNNFFLKIVHIISEPMFLLLIIAALVYFFLGEPKEGIVMLLSIFAIITINIIQEWKTDKTLQALKDLSSPKVTVIRDKKTQDIDSTDLVPGDIMLIHEGVKIPADGFVVENSGLCVDESSLTGESVNVYKKNYEDIEKDDYWRDDYCYAGTLVTFGTATVVVDKIGLKTEYGKIGVNVNKTTNQLTVLQKQVGALVKICAIIAFSLFLLVGIVTYLSLDTYLLKDRIIASILAGITLAIAMIPEEFPVVLTVFLSMGAWRLAKKKSLVKKMSSVETLGAVSVICSDKTGTITQNKMKVVETYVYKNNKVEDLAYLAAIACEEKTYDPMEIALLEFASQHEKTEKEIFSHKIIKYYPFTNETKMMGKVVELNGNNQIIIKGSLENILALCTLSNKQKSLINEEAINLSKHGLRVIGLASKVVDSKDIYEDLTSAKVDLIGLIGLFDPPKETIITDLLACYKAGIRVIMITGDNGITASSIAAQIGMKNHENIITGAMIEKMNDKELKKALKKTNVFSRVVPEHKMRLIKAFQDSGEIVAMIGDGVNDAPALKLADIGVAMGKRGSEVSRESADLILMDDNFSTIVDTVKDGRRIYDNIRKTIAYIFSIHVPIALASLFAPLLGISPENLMLFPLHIVLFELVVDPTCSIVLERQPAERNIMNRKPRNKNEKLINLKTFIRSMIQGSIIFGISFGSYYYLLMNNNDATLARTVGFSIIIVSNLFLVHVNSSNTDYAYVTIKKLLKDKVMWAINILTILLILLIIYTPLNISLKLTSISLPWLLYIFIISFIGTYWYEIVKFINKKTTKE